MSDRTITQGRKLGGVEDGQRRDVPAVAVTRRRRGAAGRGTARGDRGAVRAGPRHPRRLRRLRPPRGVAQEGLRGRAARPPTTHDRPRVAPAAPGTGRRWAVRRPRRPRRGHGRRPARDSEHPPPHPGPRHRTCPAPRASRRRDRPAPPSPRHRSGAGGQRVEPPPLPRGYRGVPARASGPLDAVLEYALTPRARILDNLGEHPGWEISQRPGLGLPHEFGEGSPGASSPPAPNAGPNWSTVPRSARPCSISSWTTPKRSKTSTVRRRLPAAPSSCAAPGRLGRRPGAGAVARRRSAGGLPACPVPAGDGLPAQAERDRPPPPPPRPAGIWCVFALTADRPLPCGPAPSKATSADATQDEAAPCRRSRQGIDIVRPMPRVRGSADGTEEEHHGQWPTGNRVG